MEAAQRIDRPAPSHLNAPFVAHAALEGGSSVGAHRLATARGASEFLRGLGLQAGDAIALWLAPGGARFRLVFAAAHLGLLMVPISLDASIVETRRTLRASRARVLLVRDDASSFDYVSAARALCEVHPDLRWIAVCDPAKDSPAGGPMVRLPSLPARWS